MIHFDDSSQDQWAVKWFKDPACKVSYNRLYLDNGNVVQVTTSMKEAAWHAGICLTKNANSYYYGFAATTNTKVPVTLPQFESMLTDVVAIFKFHKWSPADVKKRIKGHHEEAIYPKDSKTPQHLWGKLGRKIDPIGLDKSKPILDIDLFRAAVALRLKGTART